MGKNYKAVDGNWYDLRDPKEYAQVLALQAAFVRDEWGIDLAADSSDSSDMRPASKGGHAVATAETQARKAREAEALAYVAGYTGTWGLPLDIRSDSRFGSKYMRLSERQVDALLAGKARDDARAEQARINSELAADDAYQAHVAQSAPAAKAWRPAAKVEQDGMYLTPDGTIYRVQVAKLGSGNLYAKRLVVDGGQGRFEYERGAITRLDTSMRMTAEQAAQYGRLYGVCVRCGSPLTDETSIAAGIGPICRGKAWA